jgi:hypothetical protein
MVWCVWAEGMPVKNGSSMDVSSWDHSSAAVQPQEICVLCSEGSTVSLTSLMRLSHLPT